MREVAQSCPTLRPGGLLPARLLCPWDSPGKNTGVGCHSLLQVKYVNYDLKKITILYTKVQNSLILHSQHYTFITKKLYQASQYLDLLPQGVTNLPHYFS